MNKLLLRRINSPIFKNTSALMILQWFNYIIPLIIMPYLIRVIGLDNFGLFSFVQAILLYLLIITDYGFNLTATRLASINRENRIELGQLFNSVYIIKTAILLIVLLIYFLAVININYFYKDKHIFLYSIGLLIGQTLAPLWFFQGIEKMKYITIVNIASRILYAFLIVTFVKTANDFIYLPIILSISYIVLFIISFYFVLKLNKFDFRMPQTKNVLDLLKSGKNIFFSSISVSFYRNTNIIILGFFVNHEVLGSYSAAEKIIKSIQNLVMPLSQAMFPHFSIKFEKMSLFESLKLLKRFSTIYSIALSLLILILILSSNYIMLFMGIKDDLFLTIFTILSPIILLGSLNYLLGILGLVNLKKDKDFLKITIIGGVLNIILNLILIPYYEGIGSAISITISELLVLALISKRLYSLKSITKNEK